MFQQSNMHRWYYGSHQVPEHPPPQSGFDSLQRSSTTRLFALKLVQWAYVMRLVITWDWCGGSPLIVSPKLLEVFGLSAQYIGWHGGFGSGEKSVSAEESLIGSL